MRHDQLADGIEGYGYSIALTIYPGATRTVITRISLQKRRYLPCASQAQCPGACSNKSNSSNHSTNNNRNHSNNSDNGIHSNCQDGMHQWKAHGTSSIPVGDLKSTLRELSQKEALKTDPCTPVSMSCTLDLHKSQKPHICKGCRRVPPSHLLSPATKPNFPPPAFTTLCLVLLQFLLLLQFLSVLLLLQLFVL